MKIDFIHCGDHQQTKTRSQKRKDIQRKLEYIDNLKNDPTADILDLELYQRFNGDKTAKYVSLKEIRQEAIEQGCAYGKLLERSKGKKKTIIFTVIGFGLQIMINCDYLDDLMKNEETKTYVDAKINSGRISTPLKGKNAPSPVKKYNQKQTKRMEETLFEDIIPNDCLRLIFSSLVDAPIKKLVFLLPMKFVNRRWKQIADEIMASFELLPWNNFRRPRKTQFCSTAARYGWLDLIIFAYSNGCPFNDGQVFESAAENGYMNILEWGKEMILQDPFLGEIVSLSAANKRQYEVVKWAFKIGIKLDERICEFTAKHGDFGMLKWLRENGCPWDIQTCWAAAISGNFEILTWVVESGCWEETTIIKNELVGEAIRGNNLEIIKWLVSKGCEVENTYNCSAAVRVNNLEILKWLRNEGCPWNKDQCLREAKSPEMIEWITHN